VTIYRKLYKFTKGNAVHAQLMLPEIHVFYNSGGIYMMGQSESDGTI